MKTYQNIKNLSKIIFFCKKLFDGSNKIFYNKNKIYLFFKIIKLIKKYNIKMTVKNTHFDAKIAQNYQKRTHKKFQSYYLLFQTIFMGCKHF